MNKTKNYALFKFREDNREKIDKNHVKRLIESIKSRNLLELRPIIVNEKMEILDGQHRLEAAKSLGVEIFYKVEKELKNEDIILMNVAKSWTLPDYMNYYCKNGFVEYLKMKEFMEKEGISLILAVNLIVGASQEARNRFRQGKLVFTQEVISDEMTLCQQIVDYIKKMNGYSSYTRCGKFWKAMLKMIRHPDFDLKRWLSNIPMLVSKFRPQATCDDYCKLFMEVMNYRAQKKIDLLDEKNYD